MSAAARQAASGHAFSPASHRDKSGSTREPEWLREQYFGNPKYMIYILFVGLTSHSSGAHEMEKEDEISLVAWRGPQDGSEFFYLNPPQPIEKSRF
jgi:hypothetical protein